MALLFFRPRPPREFQYKPIYWDPKKEALEKRIRDVRKGLEDEGKIEKQTSEILKEDKELEEIYQDFRPELQERIRKGLLLGTLHLKRQSQKGIDHKARRSMLLRSLAILALLFALAYQLYFK